jgi:hypothetical protein
LKTIKIIQKDVRKEEKEKESEGKQKKIVK